MPTLKQKWNKVDINFVIGSCIAGCMDLLEFDIWVKEMMGGCKRTLLWMDMEWIVKNRLKFKDELDECICSA